VRDTREKREKLKKKLLRRILGETDRHLRLLALITSEVKKP